MHTPRHDELAVILDKTALTVKHVITRYVYELKVVVGRYSESGRNDA